MSALGSRKCVGGGGLAWSKGRKEEEARVDGHHILPPVSTHTPLSFAHIHPLTLVTIYTRVDGHHILPVYTHTPNLFGHHIHKLCVTRPGELSPYTDTSICTHTPFSLVTIYSVYYTATGSSHIVTHLPISLFTSPPWSTYTCIYTYILVYIHAPCTTWICTHTHASAGEQEPSQDTESP